jgi:putative membrane protein
MVTELVVAYLHFLSVLAVVGVVMTQLFLYKPGLSATAARTLQVVDALYGAAALVVVATGFLRVYWVGKGPAFYTGNPMFHALWAGFLAVGLLSIVPTVHFMRWGKGPRQGQAPAIAAGSYKSVRRALMAEIHLLALMPLLAVLMARGIGN